MNAAARAGTAVGLEDWGCPVAATRIYEILADAGLPEGTQVTLTDPEGRVRMRMVAGVDPVPPHHSAQCSVETRVPVIVSGSVVALVLASGLEPTQAVLEQATRAGAARLADAWAAAQQSTALAQEIDSLAGEIVHTYEELHLLYELGDTLTGQLTIAEAADLVLEKILNTLQATWAELSLDGEKTPTHVRLGAQANGPFIPCDNGAQRLSTTLRIGGEVIGSIGLVRLRDEPPFSSDDVKLLDAVGTLAGSALRNAQLYQELRLQAETDALTSVANYRAIHKVLDEELARASRDGSSLAIMMVDIDDFKLFNDTYGHLLGDRVLRLTCEALKEVCRAGDAVGRCGGDEFVVVLPCTDRAGALLVAQRLVDALTTRGITVPNEETLPVSLSIGVAAFPEDAVLKHDLLSHADAALYESKHCGGSGTRVATEDTASPVAGSTFGALQGLVNAVDAKDRYTREHSEVVTQAALLLARHLGLSAEACGALRIAGLLHDVGKIGIPDRILRKPGRLEAEEYRIMQQHVALSELIIKEVPNLGDVLSAVAGHHERYDGCGYPRGLRGEEIPLLGRIMAIADAYSAMLLSRPYRKGMSWADVATELRRGAGTQFDPALVEPFIRVLEDSSLVPTGSAEPHTQRSA